MKYITFRGKKVPIEFASKNTMIVIDENRTDYPNSINQILFKKYPKVTSIQHHSHYTERVDKK